jgi:hypothetical protein
VHAKAFRKLSREEETEYPVSIFLHCCLQFINDPDATRKLTQMLSTCMGDQGMEKVILSPLPTREVCQVSKQNHTGQEFKMTVELGGYEMDGVMLDLGSDMNILPKKS